MVIAVLFVFSSAMSFADIPFYSVTDLGSLGGDLSGASAINNHGQVVGNNGFTTIGFYLPFTGDRGFSYSNGTMTALDFHGTGDSWAWGVNDAGQIVGATVLVPDAVVHAGLYEGGTVTDLGTFGGTSSWAFDVNASGQVAGWAGTAQGQNRAFLYKGGVLNPLGTLGGADSEAYGVNDNGEVVGRSDTGPFGVHHAFTSSDGAMADLGTLGGSTSDGWDIDNSGQVVGGSALTSGIVGDHAFLYSGATMNDLGTLGGKYSTAYGINSNGDVVGWSDTIVANENVHAFLYTDGFMFDLNWLIPAQSGWELLSASDINDHGQIVGIGYINGHAHGYLLTPIPEPSAMLLLTLGLIGLLPLRFGCR